MLLLYRISLLSLTLLMLKLIKACLTKAGVSFLMKAGVLSLVRKSVFYDAFCTQRVISSSNLPPLVSDRWLLLRCNRSLGCLEKTIADHAVLRRILKLKKKRGKRSTPQNQRARYGGWLWGEPLSQHVLWAMSHQIATVTANTIYPADIKIIPALQYYWFSYTTVALLAIYKINLI